MSKINIRSPYFINSTASNLTSVDIDLYIYEGTQVTDRGAAKYSLSSTAVDDEVTFEISELVKDYLDFSFNNDYLSESIWVDYQITQYISSVAQTPETIVLLEGYDGYGYFEDGANPQLNDSIMMTNRIVYNLQSNAAKVPINQNTTTTVDFYYDSVLQSSETITPTAESTDNIRYMSFNGFEARVLADSGTFESNTCILSVIEEFSLDVIDEIQVDGVVVDIINVTECKQTPYKVTFVNKYGAFQDIFFFKRSILNLKTKDTEYKSNIVASGSYSINNHQYKTLTKQGQESLVLNTGYVKEAYNEVFRQLMLSEQVWINYDSQTLPIKIASSSLKFKDELNDKLIDYTINVEFAFDKINNVR